MYAHTHYILHKKMKKQENINGRIKKKKPQPIIKNIKHASK